MTTQTGHTFESFREEPMVKKISKSQLSIKIEVISTESNHPPV